MRFECISILPNPPGPAKPGFPCRCTRITLSRMLSLKEVVDRYNGSAQKSGEPVPLSAFQLTPEETARLFSALDEDYHISRFLHFSLGAGQSYTIDGEQVSHLAMDPGIASLL